MLLHRLYKRCMTQIAPPRNQSFVTALVNAYYNCFTRLRSNFAHVHFLENGIEPNLMRRNLFMQDAWSNKVLTFHLEHVLYWGSTCMQLLNTTSIFSKYEHTTSFQSTEYRLPVIYPKFTFSFFYQYRKRVMKKHGMCDILINHMTPSNCYKHLSITL